MRPAGPVPCTFARSIPCAAATRRATGVTLAPSGAARSGVGAGSRRGGGLGRGRRGAAVAGGAGGEPADDLADRHGVARLGEDLGQGPGRGRRHLGVDLVGRDLDDRLVGLDAVADRLAPLEHGALGHGLAHLRHDDVDDLGLGLGLGLRRRRLGGRRGAARRSRARSRPARRRRARCRPRRRGAWRRCRRSARAPRRRPCRWRSRRASRRRRSRRPPPCAIPARCPR